MTELTDLAYLSKHDAFVEYDGTKTGSYLNQKYEVENKGQDPDSYIGGQQIFPNKKGDGGFREILDANKEISKITEQENSVAFVGEKSSVFDTPENVKKRQEEEWNKRIADKYGLRKKSLEEIVDERNRNKPFVHTPIEEQKPGLLDTADKYVGAGIRGLGRDAIDFFRSAYQGLETAGEDVGSSVFNVTHDSNVDIQPELSAQINKYNQTTNKMIQALGLSPKETDSEFASDLGGMLLSLSMSMGIGIMFKAPALLTTMFGLSAGGDFYARMREQGVPVGEALSMSIGRGYVEGALEKWGVHSLLEAYTVKLANGLAFKVIVKNAGVEFIQESSQSFLGNFLEAPYTTGYEFESWIKQAAYEGLLAMIAAPVAGGVSLATTQNVRKKMSNILQNDGVWAYKLEPEVKQAETASSQTDTQTQESNVKPKRERELVKFTPEQADAMAAAVVLDPDIIVPQLVDIVKTENDTLADFDNIDDYVDARRKRAEEIIKSVTMEAQTGLGSTAWDMIDRLTDKAKEDAIREGVSEEEAEAYKQLTNNMVRSIAKLGHDNGYDENLLEENLGLNLTKEEIEKFVDENNKPAITETEQERIDILMGEGMSEAEAKRAVLMKEDLGSQLYSARVKKVMAEQGVSQKEAEAIVTQQRIDEDPFYFHTQAYDAEGIVGHRGRGYVGHSMSVNMAEAQAENRLPASKASKALGVSTQAIKDTLVASEWHHASSYYNKVDVYDINPYLALKEGRDLIEEGYSEDEVEEFKDNWEKMKSMPKPDKTVTQFYGDAKWIEWEGTRKHPKAIEHNENNILIEKKGSYYTFHLSDGTTVRKMIGSNGTSVISEDDKAAKAREQYLRDEYSKSLGKVLRRYNDVYNDYIRDNNLDKPGFDEFERFYTDENSAGDNYYIAGQKPYSAQKEKGLRRIHKEKGEYQLQEWNGEDWNVLETRDSFKQSYDFENIPKKRADFASDDQDYNELIGAYGRDDFDTLEKVIDRINTSENEDGVYYHTSAVAEERVKNFTDRDNPSRIKQRTLENLLPEEKDAFDRFIKSRADGDRILSNNVQPSVQNKATEAGLLQPKSGTTGENNASTQDVYGVSEAVQGEQTDSSGVSSDISSDSRGRLLGDAFYQIAFHGTPFPELEGGSFKLEKIGTGENAQAHGYGLYYTASYDVADKSYRERLTKPYTWFISFGEVEYDKKSGKYKNAFNEKTLEFEVYKDFKLDANEDYDTLIKSYEQTKGLVDNTEEKIKIAKKYKEYFINGDIHNFSDESMATGQVYEVDLPENPYLLDEQKPFSEQSDIVKKGIENAVKEIAGEDAQKQMEILREKDFLGREIYNMFSRTISDDEHKMATGRSDKAASQLFEKHGIKGITYDGREDGRCFVIFNPADVKVIQKFYQTSDAMNVRSASEQNKTSQIYRVMGQYEPAKKLITLFKGHDTTTLTHEALHHYLPIYLTMMEKGGRFDELKDLYKELGVGSYDELSRSREKVEKLIDLGTAYIFYGEAPNAASKVIFDNAKNWMRSAYDTVKQFINPSDEVKEFFDKMFADEEVSLDNLKGKGSELAKIISGAKYGQEISVKGLSLRDIANLRKAVYARVPRDGKNLDKLIREAGGIDKDTEFAKSLGYDSKKDKGGIWKKGGSIASEQDWLDFLNDHGLLAEINGENYDQTSEIWEKAVDLFHNRENVYSPEEQKLHDRRQQAIDARDIVAELLDSKYIGDIKKLEDDLRGAVNFLAEKGIAAVDKDTLEYLNKANKKLQKEYNKLLYSKKEKGYEYSTKLTRFINDLDLDNRHKSWLKDLVKNVTDEKSFDRELKKVQERASKYYEQEMRKLADDLIQKAIKASKPSKVTQQKYDYTNNKLFKDLREYNKMTKKSLENALALLQESVLQNPNSDNEVADRIRLMFLQYKANGAETSVALMQELAKVLDEAQELGRIAKSEEDFVKGLEKQERKEEVMNKLDASKVNKDSITTKIGNWYRNKISNLYSMMNSIVGKDLALKYEMETVIDRKEVKEWKHLKATSEKAMKIYGVDSYGKLLDIMAEKGKVIDKLYRKGSITDVTDEYDPNMFQDVSILDIIDIYNSIKNDKTREDYARVYGEYQLNRLLEMLTAQDMAFADMLMEDVNSRWDDLNRAYVKNYGIDLKKVPNYWMSTTDHNVDNDPTKQNMMIPSTTPSFFKERVAGQVTPIAKNAWLKYQQHISQSYYVTEVADKYKELADIFKSTKVKTRIINKFGESVYNTLREQIDSLSLNGMSMPIDDFSKSFTRLVNGWVGAKIALNPIVFVGQLTSFTNYAENVNVSSFTKNMAYAFSHPKEVIDFMMEHNGDFLKHRYEAGFNEAMNRFIAEAKELGNTKIKPSTKMAYTDILGKLVRLGDIGAIIFGGYGQFKTMLDNGMSIDEAKHMFEFSTLRSQQSGNAASTSAWQKNKGIAKIFLAFKNTSMQYSRKIADAVISYQNGDISREEATKTLVNYMVIQPALWMIAKNIAKAVLGLGDDDDEITDGVLEQMLVNPIDGIPLVGDMARYAIKLSGGKYTGDMITVPLLDDVDRSIRKLMKDDKETWDYVDVVTPFIEAMTSAPVGTTKRYIKAWSEKWED